MPERETAPDRLDRLLYVLPMAARKGGASLEELADALDVPVERVLRDLEEVTARVFYHPAGGADDLQILIERQRVRVWSAGEFRRPIRLSPREALALALGLRVLATEADEGRRAELLALARRLDRELASAPAEAFLAHYGLEGSEAGERPDRAAADGAIRGILVDASQARHRCRMRYVKPDASEPEERTIDPFAVVYGNGFWYAIGAADGGEKVRIFRLDRVLEVSETEHEFDPPADFEPADYVTGGRVYRSEEDVPVVVRYSPEIGRWILERGEGVEQTDGAVVVEHRASDPKWAVRHVLRYGPDAEILEPPGLRGVAARTAWNVAEAHAESGTNGSGTA